LKIIHSSVKKNSKNKKMDNTTGDFKVTGNLDVQQNLQVNGNSFIFGGLEIAGPFKIAGPLSVKQTVDTQALRIIDVNGSLFPDNWMGMANNIEGTTKWLHIGGITDSGARRLALIADCTYIAGNLGIGTTTPKARLDVNGAIHAGTSEIYFTHPNHNHTGFGNTEGFAAIENTSSHEALMILGRSTFKNGVFDKRIVKIWDYLEVNDNLFVRNSLSFDERGGQLINLWRQEYGIGIQDSTIYFRSGAHFAWHRGGTHSAGGIDPGGGQRVMRITGNDFVVEVANAWKPGGGSWASLSDKNLKKGIKTFGGALDKITQLRGVNFEWKEPSIMANQVGVQTGFVAQEVEKVFPEWIVIDSNGNKGISFKGFEALVVESLKELRAEIQKIKSHLKI
jgi:hypothetical protein